MSITLVAGVCLVSAVVVLFIKDYRPEYAIIISAASGALVLLTLLDSLLPMINSLFQRLNAAGLASGFTVLFKVIGITYLTDFAGDLCRDFGQTSLAGKVELAGRISIVALSLPLVDTILEITEKLIG